MLFLLNYPYYQKDLTYIDRLLKNHLIRIFKTRNRAFDISRYKNFIFDYIKKEYDFEVNEFRSISL